MNLGKNVYNLLKRQPEVFVKGLGSFKRNHTPSTYDAKRNVYLPPISYIDFDQTSSKGYDFIHYFSQLNTISLQDAEAQISAVVKEFQQKIREEGQAKLDDLGYLVSYGEGYVFKALDLSGFNYEPVTVAPVATQKPVQPASESLPPAAAEPPVASELPKPPVVSPEEQPISAEILEPFFESNSLGAKKPRKNTVLFVVIAVLALATILFIYYAVTKQSVPEQPLVTIDTPADELDTIPEFWPADTSLLSQDSLAQTLADSSQMTEKEEAVVPKKHYQWQIVIGTHPTMEKAYEHAAAMHKLGYPNVRVVPSKMAKNKKKVIWDAYETKAEMDAALRQVQKDVEKDAWPDKIN